MSTRYRHRVLDIVNFIAYQISAITVRNKESPYLHIQGRFKPAIIPVGKMIFTISLIRYSYYDLCYKNAISAL